MNAPMKIRVVTKAKTNRQTGPVCPWMVDYPETPAS
jgi:hypothetical protein